MDIFDTSSQLSRVDEDEEVKDIISNIGRSKLVVEAQEDIDEPKNMEQEKRVRREIANSNERRRMQSINSGFQSLRTLLPYHEGEKLSKAAILQQTADYIYSLEQEKMRLLSQNCQLKRLLGKTQHMVEADETDSASVPKRRIIDTGKKILLDDDAEEIADTHHKLDRERKTRMALEERVRLLETQLYCGHSKQVFQRYSKEDKCSIGKGEGTRVEVEHIPRLSDMTESQGAVEIASVQDPKTGNTRQYIVTQVDNTSKQNLETIVEAIRHLEGDHLFSEDTGPHQVVKEEVVESCLMDESGSMMLPHLAAAALPANIISLPQIPAHHLGQITLPQIPVTCLSPSLSLSQYTTVSASIPQISNSIPTIAVSMSNLQPANVTMQQISQSVSNLAATLVSSLQQPLVSPPITASHQPLPTMQLDITSIGPPQTSPVNLELQSSGHLTPISDLSHSPPQSSPVNLAHPSLQPDRHMDMQ